MKHLPFTVALGFALLHCQGTPPGRSALPAPSATAQAASSSPGAPSLAPSPAVGITNVYPGTVAIENTSDAPLRLSSKLTIERADPSGAWTKVDGLDLDGQPGKGLRLVESCTDQPAACVTLGPHATFHPVAWSGMDCSAQCNGPCGGNTFVTGRFRWVVQGCEGGAMPGPAFDLPNAQSVLGRYGVTDALDHATVARLERPPPNWDGTKPPAPGTIGGLAVRQRSERPVDAADLATLATFLRTASNFDDRVAKRCLMQTFVGLRLVRRPASTGPVRDEPADLFADFTCNALFTIRGGDARHPRTVEATHFDPGRATFVALVKKLLPDDPEIAKLK